MLGKTKRGSEVRLLLDGRAVNSVVLHVVSVLERETKVRRFRGAGLCVELWIGGGATLSDLFGGETVMFRLVWRFVCATSGTKARRAENGERGVDTRLCEEAMWDDERGPRAAATVCIPVLSNNLLLESIKPPSEKSRSTAPVRFGHTVVSKRRDLVIPGEPCGHLFFPCLFPDTS